VPTQSGLIHPGVNLPPEEALMMSKPNAADEPPLHPKRVENPEARRPGSPRAEIDDLLAAAWAQGAWIEQPPGNHFKIYPADGARRIIPVPCTPSGYRTLSNLRALMRRQGIDPDFKK
jgi:hypothetical protein